MWLLNYVAVVTALHVLSHLTGHLGMHLEMCFAFQCSSLVPNIVPSPARTYSGFNVAFAGWRFSNSKWRLAVWLAMEKSRRLVSTTQFCRALGKKG